MPTGALIGQSPVVLITGYRGLAEVFLEDLTSRGYRLSLLVRNPEAITGLRAKYPSVHFQPGDAAVGADCRSWIDAVIDTYGRIDCLINNAAVPGPGGKTNDISFIDFRVAIDINFLAPVRLTKFVLPVFLSQGSGIVINLSGGGATGARPHFSAYASAKSALVRFTETLAEEYPVLRFFAISPGGLMTPMIEKLLSLPPETLGPEYDEAMRRKRGGGEDPRKAVRLVIWLIENRPAHLNGRLINAVWDDYRHKSLPEGSPWWKLRRVDDELEKQLKEEPCRKGS